MKIQDFQVMKCSAHIHVGFSSSWSDDGFIAMSTEGGVYVTGGHCKSKRMMLSFGVLIICFLSLILPFGGATDITQNVFGQERDVQPAAFGDFNSDEYPDLFVIKNDRKTFEILLGSDVEPLLKKDPGLICNFKETITSIVPGDFDGDAIMDVLITMDAGSLCRNGNEINSVRILWGGDKLNCTDISMEYAKLCGHPLAMDYNQDMIIDLFGSNVDGNKTFWVFGHEKYTKPYIAFMQEANRVTSELRLPHSHAFIDLNSDLAADLYVTTEHHFEVWFKKPGDGFKSKPKIIEIPDHQKGNHVGQTLFMDVELQGKIDHLLPICHSPDCKNSSIYVYSSGKWCNLKIKFNDKANNVWGFVPPIADSFYSKAITLRGGDFNMDGYPDLLATLQWNGQRKNYILTNVQCKTDAQCEKFSRSFEIDWDIPLNNMNNGTDVALFYDFIQDGILDIVFVKEKGGKPNASAYKNNLDYDANFLKVMVLTGIKDKKPEVIQGPLRRKNRTFGTNLPGPVVFYNSTNQEDRPRAAMAGQLPQSAYFSLNLPYTLFGLGRTPNFIDQLTVGISGYNRTWTQLIPNSQMVVVPIPLKQPSKWTARLFITPSKLIVKSFIALLCICLLLSIIIVILYLKERTEDKYEKLQEADRFHYDAM